MGIDSASSLDDVRAAYIDAADYEETGDAAKARQFVTACRALILLLPKNVGYGSESVGLSVPEIRAELQTARRFLAAKRGGTTRYYEMRPGYRGTSRGGS